MYWYLVLAAYPKECTCDPTNKFDFLFVVYSFYSLW